MSFAHENERKYLTKLIKFSLLIQVCDKQMAMLKNSNMGKLKKATINNKAQWPASRIQLRSKSKSKAVNIETGPPVINNNGNKCNEKNVPVSEQRLAVSETIEPLSSPSVFAESNLQELYEKFDRYTEPIELNETAYSVDMSLELNRKSDDTNANDIESEQIIPLADSSSISQANTASQLSSNNMPIGGTTKIETFSQITQTPSPITANVGIQCSANARPPISFDSSTNTTFSDVRDSSEKHYLLDKEFVEQLAFRTNTNLLQMRAVINDLLIEDYLTGKYSRKLMFPIAVPAPMQMHSMYPQSVWTPIEPQTRSANSPTTIKTMAPSTMPWQHGQLSPPPSPNVQPQHQLLSQIPSKPSSAGVAETAASATSILNYPSLSTLGQPKNIGLGTRSLDKPFEINENHDEDSCDPNHAIPYEKSASNDEQLNKNLWNQRQRTSTPIRDYDGNRLDSEFKLYGSPISPISPIPNDFEDHTNNHRRRRNRADTIHYFANGPQPVDSTAVDLNLTIDLQDMSVDDRMEASIAKTSGSHSNKKKYF